MRLPLFLALSVIGVLGGTAAAAAADLPYELAPREADAGWRAQPLIVYQFEPGVAMRAYWLPPWHHRHYFPATGRVPKLGRRQHGSAVGRRPRPAETYVRYWSNAGAFPCDCRWLPARAVLPPPGERLNRFPPAPEPPNS